MERAIAWKVFADRVEPHYPRAGNGRKRFRTRPWRRRCTTAARFATLPQLSLTRSGILDETTILNFRHLLEAHNIAADALEAVPRRMRCRTASKKWCWPMQAIRVFRSARRIGGAMCTGIAMRLGKRRRLSKATLAGCWALTSGQRRVFALGRSIRFESPFKQLFRTIKIRLIDSMRTDFDVDLIRHSLKASY